ncbi:hypothetical protein DL93DRAFT_2047270, partial [Clavulina sp. PMI_390]
CLPGTRTEILGAVINWANGDAMLPDYPDHLRSIGNKKRILWLCGVAGSGKSSIAMSVALEAQEKGYLGAYYRFDRANQGRLKPSNLFTTIAQQLAHKRKATDTFETIVAACEDLPQISTSPSQQLQDLFLPLLNSLSMTAALIVIDAVDESGSIGARQGILRCLAELEVSLPPYVQILVTSRYESDVQ